MFQLTMNVDHDPLGYRRGDSVLSNAEVSSTISSGQLAQHQAVALYTLLNWKSDNLKFLKKLLALSAGRGESLFLMLVLNYRRSLLCSVSRHKISTVSNRIKISQHSISFYFTRGMCST